MRRLILPLIILVLGITVTFCSKSETDEFPPEEKLPKTLWGRIEYIKIGDSYERVKEILDHIGNADGRDKTPWLYYWIIPHYHGDVNIEFSEGIVKSIIIDWTLGYRNELATKLTNEYIQGLSLGEDTEDDVKNLLGTPNEINRLISTNRNVDQFVYYYDNFTMKLDILNEGYYIVSGGEINHVKKTKLDKITLVKK